MKSKRNIVIISSVCSVIIVSLLIFISMCRKPDNLDPGLLKDAILSSDMIRIFDEETKEVLFECRDLDEIKWFTDVFTANRNSPRAVCMAWMRYRINFYQDSKIIADVGMQRKLRFHWIHPTWKHDIDFLLTAESYGEVLPWLCEKSGKSLNELFPATDAVKGIRKRPPPLDKQKSIKQWKVEQSKGSSK